MTNKHSTQKSLNTLPFSEFLKQFTQLCNDLDELVALHFLYYQAADHFFQNQELAFKNGLSLFPSWLRERDIEVLETVNRLQAALRKERTSDSSNSEPSKHADSNSRKYWVFHKNPDGTAKHIDTVHAPNIEIALAKAEKNHSVTIPKGSTLFVKEDLFDEPDSSS